MNTFGWNFILLNHHQWLSPKINFLSHSPTSRQTTVGSQHGSSPPPPTASTSLWGTLSVALERTPSSSCPSMIPISKPSSGVTSLSLPYSLKVFQTYVPVRWIRRSGRFGFTLWSKVIAGLIYFSVSLKGSDFLFYVKSQTYRLKDKAIFFLM